MSQNCYQRPFTLKDLSKQFKSSFSRKGKIFFVWSIPCHWSLYIPFENIRKPLFFDVFSWYQKWPMAWNGLTNLSFSKRPWKVNQTIEYLESSYFQNIFENTFRAFWIIFLKNMSSVFEKCKFQIPISKCRFQSCDFSLVLWSLLGDIFESTLILVVFIGSLFWKYSNNGLVVKALDCRSSGPVFKTTGWLQSRLSLSSFWGR